MYSFSRKSLFVIAVLICFSILGGVAVIAAPTWQKITPSANKPCNVTVTTEKTILFTSDVNVSYFAMGGGGGARGGSGSSASPGNGGAGYASTISVNNVIVVNASGGAAGNAVTPNGQPGEKKTGTLSVSAGSIMKVSAGGGGGGGSNSGTYCWSPYSAMPGAGGGGGQPSGVGGAAGGGTGNCCTCGGGQPGGGGTLNVGGYGGVASNGGGGGGAVSIKYYDDGNCGT